MKHKCPPVLLGITNQLCQATQAMLSAPGIERKSQGLKPMVTFLMVVDGHGLKSTSYDLHNMQSQSTEGHRKSGHMDLETQLFVRYGTLQPSLHPKLLVPGQIWKYQAQTCSEKLSNWPLFMHQGMGWDEFQPDKKSQSE